MGDYKLRCTVIGHEKDVRSLCTALNPEGGFVSGSRDVTARVWVPNGDVDQNFMEVHRMTGHENFVSAVCVLPPTDAYPTGIIVTGSNDKTIHGYTLESATPVFTLTGHSGTVCSLAAGKFGTLISGSWDQTAKVWLNQKCMMTLQGHQAAVWAVAIIPEGGLMLTGSADKTIKMWKAGRCEKTLTGHNDCVRGLAVLNSAEFLSCANDAAIKRWLVADGSCTHTYYGHENYIYSLAIMPNGEDFVSSGEDRTLRVWRGGECRQVITHPAQSIWSACVLTNGDIVTGASDGMMRVFSNCPTRQASEEEQKTFEEQLASSAIPHQIGDIKTDQLPGPEALFNPGKRDGQTLMVKDGNNITAHSWSAAQGKWIPVGNVVGGVGGNKKLYNGKEYDFVFDVDIQEDKPPLKLPYNLTDDPWMAAHNFLADNDISQMYLDQVAKFIKEQTKGIQPDHVPAPTNNVSDPFTGGNRYVPQGGYNPPPAPAATGFSGVGADPFTGSSSYKPAGSQAFNKETNPYFPKTSYLSFDQANMDAILAKLQEFNKDLASEVQVDEASLASLADVATGNVTPAHLQTLSSLLKWPQDVVFPCLDVLRLVIRLPTANEHFYNDPAFLKMLLGELSIPNLKASNQMLILRVLVNSFKQSPGEKALMENRVDVITSMSTVVASSNKNVQIALASLLLNYCVTFRTSTDVDTRSECLQAIAQMQHVVTEPEAHFRLLVALGTLVSDNEESLALAKSLELHAYPKKTTEIKEPFKVAEISKLLSNILS